MEIDAARRISSGAPVGHPAAVTGKSPEALLISRRRRQRNEQAFAYVAKSARISIFLPLQSIFCRKVNISKRGASSPSHCEAAKRRFVSWRHRVWHVVASSPSTRQSSIGTSSPIAANVWPPLPYHGRPQARDIKSADARAAAAQ